MIVHASRGQQGIFKELDISEEKKENNVRVLDMSTKPSDEVLPFTSANPANVDMFLQFDTRKELNEAIKDLSQWLTSK